MKPKYRNVVAKLLSKSYAVGKVYATCNWKLAVVTPVPKIAKPTSFSDFRPVYTHPITCRRENFGQ